MDFIVDGPDTFRINRIEQIPNIKLTHDDIHSSCSICISNFTKNEIILILPCIHKFHRLCIQTWLNKNNTCPTCREKVFDDMDTASNTDDSSDDDEVNVSNWSFDLSNPIHSASVDFDISEGSPMSDESNRSDSSYQDQSNASFEDFFGDASEMDAEVAVSFGSPVAVSDESSSDETDSMNESRVTVSSSSSDSECSIASQIVLPVPSDDSSVDVELEIVDSDDSDDSY